MKIARPLIVIVTIISFLFILGACSYTDIASRNAAKLSGLSITDCSLIPEFSEDTYSYTAYCVALPRSVMLTPQTGDPKSVVTVNSTPVLAGESIQIQSYDYENIAIKVTSPDGIFSNTYMVTITESKYFLCNVIYSKQLITPYLSYFSYRILLHC